MQKRRQWDASLAELKRALGEHATPEALDDAGRDADPAGPHRRGDLGGRVGGAARSVSRSRALHCSATVTRGRTTRSWRAAYPGASPTRTAARRCSRPTEQLAAGQPRRRARAYAAVRRPRSRSWVGRARCAWPRSTSRKAASPRRATAASRRSSAAPSTAARTRCSPRRSSRSASTSTSIAGLRAPVRRGADAGGARASSGSCVNWKSLSPRHQKRVALSVAPWQAFVPVLVEGGATYYIKPLYMLLGECPDLETLRDQRINYDSRLWDDVRGCGGYHTVTGIEDVERTIFDRYDTVRPRAQPPGARACCPPTTRARSRSTIAAPRSATTPPATASCRATRAAASTSTSPRAPTRSCRPSATPTIRARWCASASRRWTRTLAARRARRAVAGTDVSASLPGRLLERRRRPRPARQGGRGAAVLPQGARRRAARGDRPDLVTRAHWLLGGQGAGGRVGGHARGRRASGERRRRAWRSRPRAGTPAGASPRARAPPLAASRRACAPRIATRSTPRSAPTPGWRATPPRALAAYDSVLAYQSDNPDGLRGRASALALAGRDHESFALYEEAVRDAHRAWSTCAATSRATCCGRASVDGAARQLDEARCSTPRIRPPRRCAAGPRLSAATPAPRAAHVQPGAGLGAVVRPRAHRRGRHRAAGQGDARPPSARGRRCAKRIAKRAAARVRLPPEARRAGSRCTRCRRSNAGCSSTSPQVGTGRGRDALGDEESRSLPGVHRRGRTTGSHRPFG